MRSRSLELVCLLVAVGAPLLPLPFAALALVALGAGALAFRPAPREAVAIAAGFGLAAFLLGGTWLLARSPETAAARWERAASTRYATLWSELRAANAAAATALGRPPQTAAERLTAFRVLSERVAPRGTTFLLLNPDGDAVAWGGEGLLHDPDPHTLPASGDAFIAGFSTATVLDVRPLAEGRRVWRLVAGRSLRTDTLPFRDPDWRHPRAWRWSLLAAGEPPVAGARVLAAPEAPRLVATPTGPPDPPVARPARWAWGALGLALVALAVLRGIGLAFLAGTVVRGRTRPWHVVGLALGGAGAWLLAAGAAPIDLAPLLVAAGVWIVSLLLPGAGWRRDSRWAAVAGVVGAAALLALCAAAQELGLGRDLGTRIWGSAADVALRLGLAALALALLLAAAGRDGRGTRPTVEPRSRRAWLAVTCLLGAALVLDHERWAALAVIGGFALAAAWTAEHGGLDRISASAVVVLLAALASAVAWESAHRAALRAAAPRLLRELGPPSAAEEAALESAVRAALARLDVDALSPRAAGALDRQDLAISLWRRSPLARANAWSAISVLPLQGESSQFAFGLPLRGGVRVERAPGRWAPAPLPAWDERMISGEVMLRAGDQPFGRALYWLQPRPGFRWPAERAGELGLDLLRGAPGARSIEGLPAGVRFAVYDASGHALLTPWLETPPLDGRLRRGVVNVAETPSGPADAWAESGPEGLRVLYLPRLDAFQGLDRAGTHTLATLLLAASAAVLVLLLGLPRAAFRDMLRRAVRSYSKRLLIVFTVLLLLPLLLLSFVLVHGLEERVRREQHSDGEQALASAQRVLGEYLLTLDPGFGLDTTLDDDLLSWLSNVVHHEVNLYWGSAVYASSKRELFTAGLLPKRIPGDVYARLALRGYDVASKTGHTGEVSYLEIYAPLRMPGAPAGSEGLALSMPLLAQQEETQTAIAYLRRQAVLGTAALFILLVAVAGRLARNFTRPLQELVRGTQRIAAGAASVGMAPTELELAALVEAVDRMAQRIAEARADLVRGKHVLENMVENVTAGIVSLDRERRVVLHNHVAADLLGVAIGESLPATLARQPRLQAVGEWLRKVGPALERTTVRLPGDGGEREWALVWVPLPRPGDPEALLVVEDATEILRGQRLEAWAEMARMIAHEIKNPLTPIRLSAEHMREVHASAPDRFDEVFERCTTNILRQVEDLRQIASEFGTYSRIPKLELREGDLAAAVERLVEGYRAAPPPGVAITLDGSATPIPARFDERLLSRAVRNLLENAVRASAGEGEVAVAVVRQGASTRITVADRGPGVPPDLLPRIFDPYFSTHDTGTGLGLPIARRIVEEHGGTITARNRDAAGRGGGGLEVTITIPTP